MTFLGGMATAEDVRVQKSGFELGFAPFFLFFYLVTLVLLGFTKYKGMGILALIAASFNFLAMAPLYFALTFEFNLWGPKTINHAAIGFYILVFIGMLLLFYTIWLLTQLPRKKKMYNQEELLDMNPF